jgi:Kef-type K+ transport system membrane component KefB
VTRAVILLLLVSGLTWGAQSFVPGGAEFAGSGAALAFGFLLIAAIQTGHIFHGLGLPHLTGYLLCGAVFGPEILGLITRPMVADLALVKHVAIGLIALLAGCELNIRVLRPTIRAIGFFSMGAMVCGGVLLFGLFWVATGFIPATAGLQPVQRAAIALVSANVLMAFSPAVVMGIITETRADGPLSRLTISIVVLADLVIALLFTLTNSMARQVLPGLAGAGGLGSLAGHILMSFAVGIALGAVLALYITRVRQRNGLFVIGTLFITAEAGFALGIDPLLAGLAAGLFVENVSPVSGHEVIRDTEPATLPTFVIFFGVMGAEIHLREFLSVAPWAIAAFLARAAGINLGTRLTSGLARAEPHVARLVPLGMLPQAGVALALANLVKETFGPWGSSIATLMLGAIVVNETVGPVLFKNALVTAGETGKREIAARDSEPQALGESASNSSISIRATAS